MKPLLKTAATLILTLTLAACGATGGVLPGTSQSDLPPVLEYSVGTPGDIYFTAADTPGGLDNEYTAYRCATFQEISGEDYDRLMEHYSQSATGTIGDNRLLFDWGIVIVRQDGSTITVEAYIK